MKTVDLFKMGHKLDAQPVAENCAAVSASFHGDQDYMGWYLQLAADGFPDGWNYCARAGIALTKAADKWGDPSSEDWIDQVDSLARTMLQHAAPDDATLLKWAKEIVTR